MKEIDNIVKAFATTPFLFIGSGISRRYLQLPDWKGLLTHFAQRTMENDFAYSYYENKARTLTKDDNILPKVAALIQIDFDELWFSKEEFRTIEDPRVLQNIKEGLSPFKAEVASFIDNYSIIDNKYEEEIQLLTELSVNNISGVITTNYDTFIEDHFDGYVKYIGQNQLIFSAIQGISEIYKIHGSVEVPDSLVINQSDYEAFDKKSTYLAAKLMTIFMEFPIIFLGYSISDRNIQNIIKSIVNCLDNEQLAKLQDRFVFVEYDANTTDISVSPHTITIDEKSLSMTRITLRDFSTLYKSLKNKKATLPVKLLRKLKNELYMYTITHEPTATLRVASIDDLRLSDDDLAISIGRPSDLGIKGLSGITANDWYRNIVLDDLDCTADDLLCHTYPNLARQNSGKLPVYKYLSEAINDFPDIKSFTFDEIISNTIKKNRHYAAAYSSIKDIWEKEKNNLQRATNLMAYLREDQISTNELEDILKGIFSENKDILSSEDDQLRTNLRRLIRIYDYLKWGKKELPN